MSQFIKSFSLISLAQAVCLAFGFWIHGQFVITSAEWEAGEQAAEAISSSPSASSESARSSARSFAIITADHVLNAMPAAGAISFVWIGALQSIVLYLIFSRNHSEHSRAQMKSDRESLRSLNDLVRTRDAVVFGLAKLAESRDPETGHHLERISLFSMRLASTLRRHPKYRNQMTPAFIRLIGISSALHDIGKVGLPDSILLKPGSLTRDERLLMQEHTKLGGKCLEEIERRLGNSNFLDMATEIALYHHERWDGDGYLTGLRGEQIPLSARIVSIADVYDALSVRRVYKAAFSHEKCVEMIREEAGSRFDPELVDVFLKIEPQFREISERFAEISTAEDEVSEVVAEKEFEHLLTPEQEKVFVSLLQLDRESPQLAEAVGTIA